MEVSLTTPDALRALIVELVGSRAGGAVVGAGTVLDTDDAERSIAAGARFLVAPTLSVAVIELAVAADIAVVPGAATPTEMLAAHRAGADFVKVFPASIWTPKAVEDLLAALPQLRLVPTGGVGPGHRAGLDPGRRRRGRDGQRALDRRRPRRPPLVPAGRLSLGRPRSSWSARASAK